MFNWCLNHGDFYHKHVFPFLGSTIIPDSNTEAAPWTAEREVPETTTGYSKAAGGTPANHTAAGHGPARSAPPARYMYPQPR